MNVSGSRRIAAPVAIVAAVLRDGQRLVQVVPDLRWDDQQRVILSVTSGPVRGKYRLAVLCSWPETAVCQLKFDGQGEACEFHGNGRIHLEAQNQQTIIHFAGDINVTGRLANLPPRLLLANINAIIRRTLDGIETILWPKTHLPEPEAPLPQTWMKTAVPAGLLLFVTILLVRFFSKREF